MLFGILIFVQLMEEVPEIYSKFQHFHILWDTNMLNRKVLSNIEESSGNGERKNPEVSKLEGNEVG